MSGPRSNNYKGLYAGPLNELQKRILEGMAAGKTQTVIAREVGRSRGYVSECMSGAVAKMGVDSSWQAVNRWCTYVAYRNAAAQIRSVKTHTPHLDEHVNHVLEGIADLFQDWADQRLPK